MGSNCTNIEEGATECEKGAEPMDEQMILDPLVLRYFR